MNDENRRECPECGNQHGIRCTKCCECGYDYFKGFDTGSRNMEDSQIRDGIKSNSGGYCPTIPARQRSDASGQPVIVFDMKTVSGKSKTRRGGISESKTGALDHDCAIGVIDGKVIRRLTVTECERLQGLPDSFTKFGVFEKQVWINKKERTFKIIEGVKELSDTQRYKLCGNGISLPPAIEIGKRLLEIFNEK